MLRALARRALQASGHGGAPERSQPRSGGRTTSTCRTPPPPPSLAPVPVLIIRDSAAGAGLEPLPTEDTGVSEGWERRRLVLKGLALAAAEVDGFSLGLGAVPGVGYSLGLGAVAGVAAICRLVAGVAAIVLVAVAVAGVAATGLVAPVPGVEPRPPPPTPNVVSAALAFGTGSAFHQ